MTKKILPSFLFFISAVFIFFGTLLDTTTRAEDDITAPTSSIVLSPASPDGQNGWYINPIDITISADDLGSGVKTINWDLDGTAQSQTFSNTLNLVQNSSFETAGLPLSLWDFVGDASATSTQDATPAPSLGSFSAKIVSTGNTFHGFNNLNNFAVATPYQNMTASLWLKTESATSTAFFKIYLKYDNGAGDSGTQLVATSSSITATTDWQKVSLNFVPNHSNTVGVYMEFGLQGMGTAWFDGASISSSVSEVSSNFVVSSNGSHNLSYFATDNADNVETPDHDISFKIDTKPPSRWTNFTITEAGNNHTFVVSIRVSDTTSGLDVSTAEFQYSVDQGLTWGYYQNLTGCNSTFTQGWKSLSTNPTSDGSTTVTMTTPAIDFCNSNWASFKKIRFRITDMAGNQSQSSDFTINGAWMDIVGGDVHSNYTISTQSGTNSDWIISAADSISGINSGNSWFVESYEQLPFMTYSGWYSKYPTTTALPSGRLPTTSGRYRVNSSFTISGTTIPSGLSSTQNLSAVIFVNGDLIINSNYSLHNTSGIIFIVSGDVTVANGVSAIDGFYITDGEFDIGSGSTGLTVTGGVQAELFNLKRSLSGNQNTSNPAETFNYAVKYLVIGKNVLTDNYTVTWLGVY